MVGRKKWTDDQKAAIEPELRPYQFDWIIPEQLVEISFDYDTPRSVKAQALKELAQRYHVWSTDTYKITVEDGSPFWFINVVVQPKLLRSL